MCRRGRRAAASTPLLPPFLPMRLHLAALLLLPALALPAAARVNDELVLDLDTTAEAAADGAAVDAAASDYDAASPTATPSSSQDSAFPGTSGEASADGPSSAPSGDAGVAEEDTALRVTLFGQTVRVYEAAALVALLVYIGNYVLGKSSNTNIALRFITATRGTALPSFLWHPTPYQLFTNSLCPPLYPLL